MEDLAARTHPPIGKSVIANIETGRKNDLSIPQLVTIAQALSVAPMALLVDLNDAKAWSGVDLISESGDMRHLTNGQLIEWFSGRILIEDEGDEEELLPSQLEAGRILNAVHNLIDANHRYAQQLASYASLIVELGQARDDMDRALLAAKQARDDQLDERVIEQINFERMEASIKLAEASARYQRYKDADQRRLAASNHLATLGVEVGEDNDGSATDPA